MLDRLKDRLRKAATRAKSEGGAAVVVYLSEEQWEFLDARVRRLKGHSRLLGDSPPDEYDIEDALSDLVGAYMEEVGVPHG